MNKEQVTVQIRSNICCESAWYNSLGGLLIRVKQSKKDLGLYKLVGQKLLIDKGHCTVVPPVEQQEGEVKGWCIKRTPENADVLNKWASKQGTGDYFDDCGYITSDINDKLGVSVFNHDSIKNFTELPTVEEFFAKVGYNPAPTPKLIARAGEWVKAIDIGKSKSDSISVNGAYQLHTDLYDDGCFSIKKNNKGVGHLGISTSVKFEPCPAPRTPIGEIDGVKVYEDTVSWYIDLIGLEVYECKYPQYNIHDLKMEGNGYTKNMFTPEAVNARLKEIVIEKSKYVKLSIDEYADWYNVQLEPNSVYEYAIHLIEKEFNVTYLTVNTEIK